MEALDFPDLGLLAPKRGFSVSALQSLTLFNNQFMLHGSEWLTAKIRKDKQNLSDQVSRAVQLVWQREPSDSEQQRFESYARKHGVKALCRVLLNSNEFLFVD